jgi:pyrroloquinoline quinone biosynthesis protein A
VIHENHEVLIKARQLALPPRRSHHSVRDETRPAAPPGAVTCFFEKETLMQWTTPTASDFRFGFEITMYVAAR